MNYHATHVEEVRARRIDRERAAQLLRRYPEVSSSETDEIVTFLKTGRQLEIGLLTCDDRIRPRLDAFYADHKARFRVRWPEAAALVAVILGVLAVLWLIWRPA
jgi:hypothetical protein